MATQQANPMLLKKVKKCLEIRVDTVETAQALEDLSEFYGRNTLEHRRNLRSAIERRGVDISSKLVNAFGDVVEQLDKADADVKSLTATCELMRQSVQESQKTSQQLIQLSSRLHKQEQTADAQRHLSAAFLEKFRLSEESSAVLRVHPVGDQFFDVLAELDKLQVECKAVLRTHHKRAILELMDEMTLVQETGYERLYRWLLDRVAEMDEETEVPALVRQAVTGLRSKSALFTMCLDEIASSRRTSLLNRFITALTQGGPHGVPRPIEMQAHDPIRYVGDMLAWLHQALASENDFLSGLFGRKEDGTTRTDVDSVVDKTFAGAARPLKSRLDQVIANQRSIVHAFKLSNLLQFYLQTIGGLLPSEATLTDALLDASTSAATCFRTLLTENMDTLHKSPLTCPADLVTPPVVSESLAQLGELLVSFNSSLVAAKQRRAAFQPVLEATVDPLLSSCALASHALTPDDAAVFLTNVAADTRRVLDGYEFTEWRRTQLDANIQANLDAIVKEQVVAFLRRCSLDDKIRAVDLVATSEGRLSDLPGMDVLSLSLAFKEFYSTVFHSSAVSMPIVDKLSESLLRNECRRRVSEQVADAYAKLHNAIADETSGYADPTSILLHDVERIRMLLANVA